MRDPDSMNLNHSYILQEPELLAQGQSRHGVQDGQAGVEPPLKATLTTPLLQR